MLRDLRWVAITEVFSRTASFVTVPLLARALLPSGYGLYKSILLLLSLALFFRGMANLEFLVQKYIPEVLDDNQGNVLSAAFILFLFIVGISVLFLIVMTYSGLLTLISSKLQAFASTYLLMVSLLLVSTSVYQFGNTCQRSLNRFRIYSVIKMLRETVFLSVIVILFISGLLTLRRAVLSLILANTLGILATGIVLSGLLLMPPDFLTLKEQFTRISLPIVPRVFVRKIREVAPDTIVLAVFGTSIYGKWSVIFVFVTVLTVLSQPFSKVLLPKLSQRIEHSEPLDPIVLRYYRALGILIAPAIVGGWLVGPDIIRYIFGDEYLFTAALVGILITAFGVQVINTLSGYFFIATDQSRYEMYNQLLAGSVLILFTLLGGFALHSLLVVALGFVFEQTISLMFSLWYQSRLVDFSIPSLGTVLKLAVSLITLALVVRMLQSYTSDLPHTFVVVGIGATTYFMTLAAVGFFTDEDIALAKQFIGI